MRRSVAGIPIWTWAAAAAVVLGGVYYYRRQQKAAQSAASAAAASASQQQGSSSSGGAQGDPFLTAYQAGEASGASTYQEGVSTGISTVQAILGMFPPEAVGSAAQPTTGAAAPAPAQPVTKATTPPAPTKGEGVITIGGHQYVVMGTETNRLFTGYNVGGGAPVYFGNVNHIAQGLPPATGTLDVYTPIEYADFISSTKVSNERLH